VIRDEQVICICDWLLLHFGVRGQAAGLE
jgi:hypothetical protein